MSHRGRNCDARFSRGNLCMNIDLRFLIPMLLWVPSAGSTAEPDVDPRTDSTRFFEQKIRPVLVKHCYECHSAQTQSPKAGLRLDYRGGWHRGGQSGRSIIAGNPDASLLFKVLKYQGPKMPPGGQLDPRIIADFRSWILSGAVDPRKTRPAAGSHPGAADQLWSLSKLVRPRVPQAGDGWARNPIDAFVKHRQQEAGLAPSPPASPKALLRRLAFSLIGLPPQASTLTSRENDTSDLKYIRVVDQLLSSPRYGERWARHWLDIARFAESSGFEQDYDRPHAFHYRDFLIRALNDDLPYNEFVRLQIAGDQLRPADPQAAVATGFVVAGVENLIQSRKEFERDRYDKLDDMVSTMGTGLLGIAVGCARCHDHKYDPLSQQEYYRLAAAFAGTIGAVRNLGTTGTELTAYVATEVPDRVIPMVVVTEPSFKNLPSIAAEVHFLARGEVTGKGAAVQTDFPRMLVRAAPVPRLWERDSRQATGLAGRAAVAHWITDVQHGAGHLLARVIVNRLWQHHFGRGIVATPSDFGHRGSAPTHPQLLDWLACELIEGHWRLKPIHRLIVTSATYRQSHRTANDGSQFAAFKRIDPDNRRLWRRQPRRLDAEAIRDNLLSVSGRLQSTMYGPGTLNENSHRRSVYLTTKRSRLIPILQLFDAPDSLQGLGSRQETVTATQGLLALNHPLVTASADALAARLANQQLLDDDAFIREGFLLAIGRDPKPAEHELCEQILLPRTPHSQRDFCQMLLCLNEFLYVE